MKRLELAKVALSRFRIYLDQMYWIYCREAAADVSQRPIHSEIWHVLRDLARAEKVICPFSYAVFSETMREGNHARVSAQAEILDTLSHGIAIQPLDQLAYTEFVHFLSDALGRPGQTRPLNEMVWTHTLGVVGEPIPTATPFEADVEAHLQKRWINDLSEFKASHWISALAAGSETRSVFDDYEHQREKNEQCGSHSGDFKSFAEVRQIEVAGHLDGVEDALRAAIGFVYERRMGHSFQRIPAQEQDDAVHMVKNMIYHACRLGTLGQRLPQLDIGSGIHATIRYEQRPYKKGDLNDHLHAASALPYCNMFFTERVLGRLLTSSRLRFDQLYDCRVLWRDEDVLNALRELAS